MKKITFEQALMMLVLGLTGCCIGLILCFAAEHHVRTQYEQAANTLAEVCHYALDDDNLDCVAFEEAYSDIIGNRCLNSCIDEEFMSHLGWAH